MTKNSRKLRAGPRDRQVWKGGIALHSSHKHLPAAMCKPQLCPSLEQAWTGHCTKPSPQSFQSKHLWQHNPSARDYPTTKGVGKYGRAKENKTVSSSPKLLPVLCSLVPASAVRHLRKRQSCAIICCWQ